MKPPSEPLDFSPSSTALDPADAAQDQSTNFQTGRHGYTDNATYASGEIEVPVRKYEPDGSDPRSWDSLNEANRNWDADGDGMKQAQRQHDQRNDTIAWGRTIGLSDHELRRAVYLVNANFDDDDQQYVGAAVSLAALTIVANEDHGPEPPKIIRGSAESLAEDPESTFTHLPHCIDAYETIRTDLDISHRQIRDAREYIRKLV